MTLLAELYRDGNSLVVAAHRVKFPYPVEIELESTSWINHFQHEQNIFDWLHKHVNRDNFDYKVAVKRRDKNKNPVEALLIYFTTRTDAIQTKLRWSGVSE